MNALRFVRALVALCALQFFYGCAALAPGSADVATRAAPFDLLGRVLVNSAGQAFTSNVRWVHAASRDEIWLLTPTGQALAHIVEDGDGAVLTGADQRRYQAARVESLTRQALGWEFPLARLQHWARGAAVPGVDVTTIERDAQGRITKLVQEGWQISYEYPQPPESSEAPRRVGLTSGTSSIRLVIDEWRAESLQ